LLVGNEEKYPANLEMQYPRVFNNIMNVWGTAKVDDYLGSLLIDDRGGRQGFPTKVMQDILFLYSLREKLKGAGPSKQDAWAEEVEKRGFSGNASEWGTATTLRAGEFRVWFNDETKRILEQERIEYTPRGFFHAIEIGNERAIQLFLAAGVSIELENDAGWTPLLASVFMGSESVALLLLKAGARVDVRDDRGHSPLHWAAFQGYVKAAQMLLDKGAGPNAKSAKGLTPLLQAAARGHTEVVRVLLKHGVAVNEADEEGWTALHKAVANDHLEVVRLLMAARADPHARHTSGVTPVSIAQRNKNLEIIAAVGK
jgi:ankyrin repeat protein